MTTTFTDRFTVDTNGVLIARGATPGNGIIPDNVSLKAINIGVESSATYWVKGTHNASAWAKVESGAPYPIGGLTADTWEIIYIKADSATITVNLHVKG